MTIKKNYPWSNPIGETNHYHVYRDKYPVTEGHLLFIPREDLEEHITKCFEGAYKQGQALVEEGFCDGYNVGMNMGKHAGQTVMYPHIHFIPRREGDLGRFENGTAYDPTGGIRNVFPGKGKY
tara:strand:- start:5067 stop:5435 length:369 start_codon:yes stop_codon:yes gene_type:complete